jgi:formylglycine-generating enzyme required for sulfatase activity
MKAKIAVRDFQVAKVIAGAVCEQRVGSAQHFVYPLADHVDLVLVEIPGGGFTMGGPQGELGQRSNEEPLHEVEILPFLMGTHTVTQAQWSAVMGALPRLPESFLDPGLPVVNASWPDVLLFCQKLTE